MLTTGGMIGILWLWLLGILLTLLALRLILATVLSVYLRSRAEAGFAPTLWSQAYDAATRKSRSAKSILSLAALPEGSHPEWLQQGGATPPTGPGRQVEAKRAVCAWSEQRVHKLLDVKGLHPQEAMSSASLASALGAETWAERVRIDSIIESAMKACGSSGQDKATPAVSLGDSARLASRLDANVAAITSELCSIYALLDSRAPPSQLLVTAPAGGGMSECDLSCSDARMEGAIAAAPIGMVALPPGAFGGGSEATAQQPPPPDRTPPAMPGLSMPLALPGVPEGLEPGAGGLLRRLSANSQATALDLKVMLAQSQGVSHEDHELLISGRIVFGNTRLHDLLEGQDPDDVEAALLPATVPGEAPLNTEFSPHHVQVLPQLGIGAPRALGDGCGAVSAEALEEDRAAREERLDALDRGDAWRCAQLEDWVARLMQGVEHLEHRRGQVAEERLQKLESLEQSLDDLFERIRPALGGPLEPA